MRERIFKALLKHVAKHNEFPSTFLLAKNGITRYSIDTAFGNYKACQRAFKRAHPKAFALVKSQIAKTRDSAVNAVVEYVRENKTIPTWEDIRNLGFPRESLRNIGFSRHVELIGAARKAAPDVFAILIDTTIFTKVHTRAVEKSVHGFNRFVITTAVQGCDVNEGFLNAIKKYCEVNEARLLVLSSADPASQNPWELDHRIGREHVVVEDLRLNNNLFVSTIKLSAKHIDPTTGLTRLGQRNGTFIYASPKQRLRAAATVANRIPHVIMTTGAITIPNYATDRYMSERTAYIATHDHVMGAIVVELEDDNYFHFRQIQARADGSFNDLGYRYSSGGVVNETAAAVVMGDWHSGETDPVAKKVWQMLCKQVQPTELVVHDGFNGRSINHHERDNTLLRAQHSKQGFLNLESEVAGFAADLDELTTWAKRVVVVESNHDAFLTRYLESGLYTDDAENYAFAITLAQAALNDKYPLRFGVETNGLKNKNRVHWTMADESHKIAGVEVGAHGHLGPNGSRNPGLASLESCFGESITGHSHVREILRGAWRVGTSSFLRLTYNNGPSGWTHTSCVLYRDGSRQLINVVNGKYTTLNLKKLNALGDKNGK